MVDAHEHPYITFFKKYVQNLGEPDENGWATGDCPHCGESGTFQVNLKTGYWTCFPKPSEQNCPPSPQRGNTF